MNVLREGSSSGALNTRLADGGNARLRSTGDEPCCMFGLNSAPRSARRRDPPAARVPRCEQRLRPLLARGRGRGVRAHGRRAVHARGPRLDRRAPALVRGELLSCSRAQPVLSSTAGPTVSCPAPAASSRSASATRGSGRGTEPRAGSTCTRRSRASTAPAGRTPSSSGRAATRRRGPLDMRDPRTRNLFRLDEGQMELDRLKAGARSRRADGLGEHGDGAARLQRDRGEDAGRPAARRAAAHDVHGRVRARRRRAPARSPARGVVRDRSRARSRRRPTASSYILRAGDLFWTGVGCVHAFYNRTAAHVRWLETQSPQPPARHSYRFNRDWEYLQDSIATV